MMVTIALAARFATGLVQAKIRHVHKNAAGPAL
jgi:hypothetical protein